LGKREKHLNKRGRIQAHFPKKGSVRARYGKERKKKSSSHEKKEKGATLLVCVAKSRVTVVGSLASAEGKRRLTPGFQRPLRGQKRGVRSAHTKLREKEGRSLSVFEGKKGQEPVCRTGRVTLYSNQVRKKALSTGGGRKAKRPDRHQLNIREKNDVF